MTANPKEILKYSVVLVITAVLFWFLFRDIPLNEFKKALKEFNYNWIFVSVALSILSHFLRAWRWTLLINSSKHQIKLSTSYFSVMIGYLMNSFFPRLGEVTRCGVAYKTDKIPIPFALGTVITERFIDLLMLLIISALTFSLQFNLLQEYFISASNQIEYLFNEYWMILLISILMGLFALGLLFYLGQKKEQGVFFKILNFIKQGINGVLSVGKVKNQKGFWFGTLSIWVLYFLMMYVISLGSDITKDLGLMASLAILVMGSFGMASPTPNGLVTFHAFVAGVLVLYGIPKEDGIIFATILHTSQLLTILIIGSISLILVNVRQKKQQFESQQT